MSMPSGGMLSGRPTTDSSSAATYPRSASGTELSSSSRLAGIVWGSRPWIRYSSSDHVASCVVRSHDQPPMGARCSTSASSVSMTERWPSAPAARSGSEYDMYTGRYRSAPAGRRPGPGIVPRIGKARQRGGRQLLLGSRLGGRPYSVGDLEPVGELAGEMPAVGGDHRAGDGLGELDVEADVEAVGLVAEQVADAADRGAAHAARDGDPGDGERRVGRGADGSD